MSEFKKLNGYDVKDNQARNDISTIQSRVGDLSNLETTDKSSIVNAINEVQTYRDITLNESRIYNDDGDILNVIELTKIISGDSIIVQDEPLYVTIPYKIKYLYGLNCSFSYDVSGDRYTHIVPNDNVGNNTFDISIYTLNGEEDITHIRLTPTFTESTITDIVLHLMFTPVESNTPQL